MYHVFITLFVTLKNGEFAEGLIDATTHSLHSKSPQVFPTEKEAKDWIDKNGDREQYKYFIIKSI